MSDVDKFLAGLHDLEPSQAEAVMAKVLVHARGQQQQPVKLAFPGLTSMAFIESFVAPSLCFFDDVTGIFLYASPQLLPNLVPEEVAPTATSLASPIILKIPATVRVSKEELTRAFKRTVMQAIGPTFGDGKVTVMLDMESSERPTSFGDAWQQLFGLAIFQAEAAQVTASIEFMRELVNRTAKE